MFVTDKLNAILDCIETHSFSEQLKNLLQLQYINLEATLLRAKVLRELSKAKVQYIVQSAIQKEQANVAFLFAPFILANLNYPVIYNSPATPTVLNILNRYYNVELKQNVKIDDALEALNIYLDLTDTHLSDVDFFYFSLIKALCRNDVSQLFLVTDLPLNTQKIAELEHFFKVKIHSIQVNPKDTIIDSSEWNMRKLFLKNKDQQYIDLCEKFAVLNAHLLLSYGSYNQQQATQLVEDMFYTEHIYEKLSVYAEYMQTCVQHGLSRFSPSKSEIMLA